MVVTAPVDGKEHCAAQAFQGRLGHRAFRGSLPRARRGRAHCKAVHGLRNTPVAARNRLVAPGDRIVVHWSGLRMPADT
jgi:hypothetical protein